VACAATGVREEQTNTAKSTAKIAAGGLPGWRSGRENVEIIWAQPRKAKFTANDAITPSAEITSDEAMI